MAPSSNASLDTAVVLAFSSVSALFIALIPLLTTIYRSSLPTYAVYLIMLLLLPVLSWAITCLFNVFIQMIRCGSVNAPQVLINGVPTVGFVALLGGLSQLIPIMRYPIEVVLPMTFTPEMKKGLAVSFYIFWGAIYGQSLGGSLSQSCGTGTAAAPPAAPPAGIATTTAASTRN